MKRKRRSDALIVAVVIALGSVTVHADHHRVTVEGTMKAPKAEIETKITIPAQRLRRSDGCEVSVDLRYGQRHTVARVTTTISKSQCAPAEGAYTLRVRTLDAAGERQTRDYRETWRRDVDEPIEKTQDIDLEGDPTLVWVRARKSAKDDCTCLVEEAESP